jgi:hypothetical protein
MFVGFLGHKIFCRKILLAKKIFSKKVHIFLLFDCELKKGLKNNFLVFDSYKKLLNIFLYFYIIREAIRRRRDGE